MSLFGCRAFESINTLPMWNPFLLLTSCAFGFMSAQGPSVSVTAVLNGTAALPCDISPSTTSDSAILVVWYRNELSPIYSFDGRISSSKLGAHWNDKMRLGDRAHFHTLPNPAFLSINNLRESDEGQYRCRVDFSNSPTRNFKVFLLVTIPPKKPVILNAIGHVITTPITGPFVEGSDAKFLCRVEGGKPEPSIRWLKEGELLESSELSATFDEKSVKQREVVVHNLNRADLNKSLVCQASNNNFNSALSTAIYLDVYYKPFNVTILDSNEPLSVNKEYKIVCIAFGSRPYAILTWWLNSIMVSNYTEEVSDYNTTSILIFTPKLKDHNKTLTCRAENPLITGTTLEAITIIDVTFAPVLKLNLGSEYNPADIEEGDDVYFECKITANPAAHKIEWQHNDMIIQANTKNVLVINHRTLILQKIKKHMAGKYSCTASNVEGDGVSNELHLRVMYKPVCKPNQKNIYGVAKEENAEVVCEVESFPPPDLFKWLFNHTTKPLPEARYLTVDSRKGMSILTFSPQTDIDYGILMCYAVNVVGKQAEPCIFHIIPAGLPESPYNCMVSNQTSNSINISCSIGFDNGHSQFFIAEVVDQLTDSLVANISSSKLSFEISRLSPGKSLKMNIYAVNARGRSEAVILETYTLEKAQKQTGQPSDSQMTHLLTVFSGFVALCSVLGMVTSCVLRARVTTRPQSSYIAAGDILATEETKCKSTLDGYNVKKTPDVIQCNNKGIDEYWTAIIEDKSAGSEVGAKCAAAAATSSLADTPLVIVPPCTYNERDESQQEPQKQPQPQQRNALPIFLKTNYKDHVPAVTVTSMLTTGVPPHSSSSPSLPSPSSTLHLHSSISTITDTAAAAAAKHADCEHRSPVIAISKYLAECASTSIAPHHREVITVRTLLRCNDQESCV